MRIGQVVSFGVGGADKCSINLVKGLLEIDEDVEIIVFHNKKSHPKYESINPSRYNEYKSLPIQMVSFEKVTEFNNYDLDILNTHRPGDDTWFLPNFEQTKFNFKIVETNFHGHTRSKADFRVFPSHSMIRQASSIPCFIIPNPINRKITDSNLKDELNIGNKFVYGRISRPCLNIYSDVNLRAYKNIESNDTCFIYVAPNSKTKTDAQRLGIKNIIFLDPTSDELTVSKIYNTFDVLCHSNSLGETFGNTIAEAMMHGKPIITHVGNPIWSQAHREHVGNKTELYLTSNIVAGYSNLMLKFKNDKKYYDEISSYLKNRALSLYDYVIVSKRYFELYKKLIN